MALGGLGQEAKRILCNNCKQITHHCLRSRYSRVCQVLIDDAGEAWWFGFGPQPSEDRTDFAGSQYDKPIDSLNQVRTSIWSCAGCEEETFEREYLIGVSDNEWEEVERVYYPTRRTSAIRPKRFLHIGPQLGQIYGELIDSFNTGSLLLCSIGLRALLEGVCKDKGISEGNLERKIDSLSKFVPSLNVIEALHTFRVAGNDAAHELQPPSSEEMAKKIEIVEDLLNALYLLDYKASQVRIATSKGVRKSSAVH